MTGIVSLIMSAEVSIDIELYYTSYSACVSTVKISESKCCPMFLLFDIADVFSRFLINIDNSSIIGVDTSVWPVQF